MNPPLSLKATAFAIMDRHKDIDVTWCGTSATIRRPTVNRFREGVETAEDLLDACSKLSKLRPVYRRPMEQRTAAIDSWNAELEYMT